MWLLAVVAGVVLWSCPAEAIKWDFDDGTTQGWAAQNSGGSQGHVPLLRGVVEDGVWRIEVVPAVSEALIPNFYPLLLLVSSTIGYDSSLFDQLRIRFRTVHHRPTEGTFALNWTNEHNFLSAGSEPEFPPPPENRFAIFPQPIVYTTQWQEMAFSLEGRDEKIWEGLLKDIRLDFSLDKEALDLEEFDPLVDGRIEWFEVDWIELTGVEEFLQGELAPPDVDYFRFEGVGVFAPPVFYPIAPGIGDSWVSLFGGGEGVLTDLDGDGDSDLFAVWRYRQPDEFGRRTGWLMAVNDGQGALKLRRTEEIAASEAPSIDEETGIRVASAVSLAALAGDVTGDGKDEIAISINNAGWVTEVWSIDAELQVEVLVQIAAGWLVDVVDWDGDGRDEVFVGTLSFEEGGTLEVWDVEQGVWTAEELGALERHVPGQLGDFTGDGTFDVVWVPIFRQADTWIVSPLGAAVPSGTVFAFDEWRRPPLGVGDFDGDGQVDFLTEFIHDLYEGDKGLVLQRKHAGDRLEATVLYDERLFLLSQVVLVRDLNADGVADWVFIGGDRASGVGVFVEWGGRSRLTQQGEQHRLEGSGTHVLSGDMDGDGDVDLVVLDPVWGGVHVLRSSLAAQPTAVLAQQRIGLPERTQLHQNAPNPFNSQTMFSYFLLAPGPTRLEVFTLTGQRVAVLHTGLQQAGHHRLVWDGRDREGRPLASGVYLYRLVSAEGVLTRKLILLR